LRTRYGIDVRARHEVTRIDRAKKCVEVKNLLSGETFTQNYDQLVLAPGAAPVRPPIPGADGPKVFVLNDLADMDAVAAAIPNAKQACVIGAGFIGLELVENLHARGLDVTLVEMLDHVMPRMDKEMTEPLLQELELHGVRVHLEDSAQAIEGAHVLLKSGARIESDFVCLCVGVRATTKLAADAGLTLNPRGAIRVDEHMRTNDPDIYAVGDAVEVRDFVTGEPVNIPLAGPANRQGRLAADAICGRTVAYRGSQGTAIVKVFGLAAAQVGQTEMQIKAAGSLYRKIYVYPTQHPSYYPGAATLTVKLLFTPEGRILGAQVTGTEGVDVVINAFAMAQRAGMSVEDLEHVELAYAPQWGGAKHPVNIAGFVASNLLRGDVETFEPADIPNDLFLLDVRTPSEIEAGMIPGATPIPVDELRDRLEELPHDKEIGVYCAVGRRGYIATRILRQRGFRARNLDGGFKTWCLHHTEKKECLDMSNTPQKPEPPAPACGGQTHTLDVSGLQCPDRC
jgi:NADPH-dependent 2,4-dienoyl-CoA reductase/sulfur reductase-like enzyme/rhodanese-related sulfurtransferase